jgi:hypothetical protein
MLKDYFLFQLQRVQRKGFTDYGSEGDGTIKNIPA